MRIKHLVLGALCALGLNAQAALQSKEASGWLESAYMEFTGIGENVKYNAYISADGGATWKALDPELVRSYGTYGRVDALGLAAGSNYKLKVVAVDENGTETADQVESETLTVVNYKREGFAHTEGYAVNGGTGVGAYNNDGTLKSGAKVFYVSAATAKTISTNVTGAEKNPCVGMQAIITAYQKGQDHTPIAFRIIGKVAPADMDALDSSAEGLQVKGKAKGDVMNMTIEGVGNDAMLTFGLLVRNTTSLEIRNLGVATTLDDDVSLDTDNDHVWIHNLDVFYGPNKGGDQKKGDGAIDIKGNSKHVTVASCHFWDTGKSSMCGMTQDTEPNYITYHDNWFDHSDSRHARIRRMSVHMYNNYYDGVAKYGVGVCNGGSVFMESNYFRNCKKPMLISKQGTDIHMGVGTSDETKGTFSGEDGGIIKSFGNTYVGTYTLVTYQTNSTHFDCWEATNRNDKVPAEVKTLQGGTSYDNFDTDASLMYAYAAAAAADVPANVTGFYGAGRINHGDLKFTFTDADDASDEVNDALRSAIDNYTSSLKAIVGYGTSAGTVDPGTDPITDPSVTPTPGGSYEWYVSGGKGTSGFYTINGNYSNSKGSVTYGGNTYDECLKMETNTVVTFTTTETLTFVIVTNGSGNKIKIDDVVKTTTNGILTITLEAGTHTIKKSDGLNIFYMNATAEEPTGIRNANVDNKPAKFIKNGKMYVRKGDKTYNMNGSQAK